jgi:hypothetical protein
MKGMLKNDIPDLRDHASDRCLCDRHGRKTTQLFEQ